MVYIERENRQQPATDTAHGGGPARGRGAGKGSSVARGRGAARGRGVASRDGYAKGHDAARGHGGNGTTAWVPGLHEEQTVLKHEY